MALVFDSHDMETDCNLKKPITLCFQLIELFDTFLLEFTYQKGCLRIFCFDFSLALAKKCGTNLPIHSPFNYRRVKGNWGKGGTKAHVNTMCPLRGKVNRGLSFLSVSCLQDFRKYRE